MTAPEEDDDFVERWAAKVLIQFSNKETEELGRVGYSGEVFDKLVETTAVALAEMFLEAMPFDHFWADRAKIKQGMQKHIASGRFRTNPKLANYADYIFEKMIVIEAEKRKKKAIAEIEAWKILALANR